MMMMMGRGLLLIFVGEVGLMMSLSLSLVSDDECGLVLVLIIHPDLVLLCYPRHLSLLIRWFSDCLEGGLMD
jgi:hypothetical protein